MQFQEWYDLGEKINVGGHNIFVVDSKTPNVPTMVVLHGYPSGSFDYHHLFTQSKNKYRIVLHDFLGFGFSDKPSNYNYLLKDQADHVENLLSTSGVGDYHLVAHDYGTSVATELIARSNARSLKQNILSLTLCNGSMLIDMAQLKPIQKILKAPILGPMVGSLIPKSIFLKNMRSIWHDPNKVDEDELEILWKMLLLQNGRKWIGKITRYIDQRYRNYDRWIGALKKTEIPTHILWAENDPVAVKAMADRLATFISNNKKTILPRLGHYPMLEEPKLWIGKLEGFIDEQS